MPLCCGKKKTKEELEQEQYEKDLAKFYLKDQIYVDDAGNLRYGEKKFDPEYELSVIVDKDDQVEEEGKIWYVVSTGWMNAWLLYCHLNRGVNPNPGRIDNESLLESNSDKTAFVPKEGLEMARKNKEGDYRRISEAAWKALCEFYPGSGPAIKTEFIPDDNHAKDGMYDCSCWQIDQTMYNLLMGKVKEKKSMFSFGKKKKDDDVTAPRDVSVDLLVDPDGEGMEMAENKNTGTTLKQFFGDSAVKSDDNSKEEDDTHEVRETSESWLFD